MAECRPVLAWLAWLFLHLMYLVGFRNRVLVAMQWAIQYFTFNWGARLITGATIEKDGRFQGIQLWINLPAVQKMLPASYQPLTNEQIVLLTDQGVEFRLVSGNYLELKGPAKSDVFTATLRMQAGSVFEFDFPESDNVVFYILEGNIEINESRKVETFHLAVFDHSDGKIKLTAASDSKLLVMSGTPINEPLVTHGPFVMNTDTQILEAMRDYKMGKMGILIQ